MKKARIFLICIIVFIGIIDIGNEAKSKTIEYNMDVQNTVAEESNINVLYSLFGFSIIFGIIFGYLKIDKVIKEETQIITSIVYFIISTIICIFFSKEITIFNSFENLERFLTIGVCEIINIICFMLGILISTSKRERNRLKRLFRD